MDSIILGNGVSIYKETLISNGSFYNCEVNTTENVYLDGQDLVQLPVRFGTVKGYFSCSNNKLTSLEGAPRETSSSFYCDGNKLTSLEGVHKIIKKINGTFNCKYNFIKSGGIGLLLIEGLTEIDSELRVFEIIEKYLGQGKRGLLACQEELIENNFEEYAKL